MRDEVGISGVRQIAVSVSDLDAEPSLAFLAAGDVRLIVDGRDR